MSATNTVRHLRIIEKTYKGSYLITNDKLRAGSRYFLRYTVWIDRVPGGKFPPSVTRFWPVVA